MNAPLYMIIVTLYFIFLPFLLGVTIYQATQKRYKLHIQLQTSIFALTIAIIIYFEIMLRISGGFLNYKQYSSFDESFMIIYLIVHILIAIAAILLWAYLILSSIKDYKNNRLNSKKHKRMGKILFTLLTTSCIMGTGMYGMLFLS